LNVTPEEASEMSHVAIIQKIYEAFGRGDVPAILDRLSETVEWETEGGHETIPWLAPRKGHAGAREFFHSLAAIEIHSFQPHTFLEQNQLVVALIDIEATVKATGKRYVEKDEVHLWRFDETNRVAHFRHRVDTLRQYQALQK
jgi:ketosteroid isomerase-like protein